ncbi:DSBA-like thioredoxin domain protein [Metarhizium acridum CQMa 102]|uniref:DSBA-like thioredoxin domain protein n=1 Tax=Metarhizium acridum (strain CQMa 102) TaxID=655827 RepID=E9E0V8_METAQ|nr:DSBA-like thioredoxin domain protein [Metarhizium acridum CQMa 102]EFY90512.1 DSBA-like thioredoxin domain protein [Metarhizium acridum CQMa 102]
MKKFESKHPQVEFEVVWRSFCLNPLFKTSTFTTCFPSTSTQTRLILPKTTSTYRQPFHANEEPLNTTDRGSECGKIALYDEMAGGPGKFQPHLDRVSAVGASYGLKFFVRGDTGPTRASQILIANILRRRGPAAQARVVEALFRSHLLDGKDISDEDVLVSLGSEIAGLPADVVRSDLRDDDNGRFVDDEAEAAVEEKGVEAVPCVTVLGKYKVGGYQEQEVFDKLFERIWAENARVLSKP